jgi:F0F1-type ATP synthase membrane subunit b/b'
MSNAFAALESYLEGDVNITTEVTVPADEIEEQVSDAVEQVQEGEQITADTDAAADAAEMVSREFDRINTLRAHIAQFGIDRTLLSLYNRDGELSRLLKIKLPSCESFDAVGNPSSSVSIAAMEGLGEVAEKAWDWIKSLWRKLVELVQRAWEWASGFFRSIKSRAERLEKYAADRIWDKEAKELELPKVYNIGGIPSELQTPEDAISQIDELANQLKVEVVGLTMNSKGNLKHNTEGELNYAGAMKAKIKSARANFSAKKEKIEAAKAQAEFAKLIADCKKDLSDTTKKFMETVKEAQKKADKAVDDAKSSLKSAAKEAKATAQEALDKARETAKEASRKVSLAKALTDYVAFVLGLKLKNANKIVHHFTKSAAA